MNANTTLRGLTIDKVTTPLRAAIDRTNHPYRGVRVFNTELATRWAFKVLASHARPNERKVDPNDIDDVVSEAALIFYRKVDGMMKTVWGWIGKHADLTDTELTKFSVRMAAKKFGLYERRYDRRNKPLTTEEPETGAVRIEAGDVPEYLKKVVEAYVVEGLRTKKDVSEYLDISRPTLDSYLKKLAE